MSPVRNGQIVRPPCQFFTYQFTCPVCGRSSVPVLLKTMKCAGDTYGPDHDNDWIDCYEGCIRHDEVARKRWRQSTRVRSRGASKPKKAASNKMSQEDLKKRKRESARRLAAQKRDQELAKRSPVPTLARLSNVHRIPLDKQHDWLAGRLRKALAERFIRIVDVARWMGVSSSTLENALIEHRRKRSATGKVPLTSSSLTFTRVAGIIAYLQFWETEYRKRLYEKEQKL